MTELLNNAIAQLKTLPANEQDAIASIILEEIEMTEQQQFEITIDQLHFGFYKANDLQGKLFDLEYYSLNSNTKKVSLEQNPCCN